MIACRQNSGQDFGALTNSPSRPSKRGGEKGEAQTDTVSFTPQHRVVWPFVQNLFLYVCLLGHCAAISKHFRGRTFQIQHRSRGLRRPTLQAPWPPSFPACELKQFFWLRIMNRTYCAEIHYRSRIVLFQRFCWLLMPALFDSYAMRQPLRSHVQAFASFIVSRISFPCVIGFYFGNYAFFWIFETVP